MRIVVYTVHIWRERERERADRLPIVAYQIIMNIMNSILFHLLNVSLSHEQFAFGFLPFCQSFQLPETIGYWTSTNRITPMLLLESQRGTTYGSSLGSPAWKTACISQFCLEQQTKAMILHGLFQQHIFIFTIRPLDHQYPVTMPLLNKHSRVQARLTVQVMRRRRSLLVLLLKNLKTVMEDSGGYKASSAPLRIERIEKNKK